VHQQVSHAATTHHVTHMLQQPSRLFLLLLIINHTRLQTTHKSFKIFSSTPGGMLDHGQLLLLLQAQKQHLQYPNFMNYILAPVYWKILQP
jgi:hypothetical protein